MVTMAGQDLESVACAPMCIQWKPMRHSLLCVASGYGNLSYGVQLCICKLEGKSVLIVCYPCLIQGVFHPYYDLWLSVDIFH